MCDEYRVYFMDGSYKDLVGQNTDHGFVNVDVPQNMIRVYPWHRIELVVKDYR